MLVDPESWPPTLKQGAGPHSVVLSIFVSIHMPSCIPSQPKAADLSFLLCCLSWLLCIVTSRAQLARQLPRNLKVCLAAARRQLISKPLR